MEAQTGTILLFNKAYPPWPGGIERHVELLAEGLSARGWQVVVLCAGNQRFQYEERREGLHVRREANWGTLWSQPISPGLIRQIGRLQPDLVHIHTPFPFGNLALSIRRPRCRLVVTWHSDIVRQRVARPFLIPLENWLLRRADAVIATSPALLEQSAYLPRYREKCHIIPLGIDPKSYFSMEPAVLEKAERLRKSLPHPLAVFVGRLVGYKGLEVLLRAVKKTGNVSALIVGDGPLRGDLERQTGRMGLTDRVRFAGHVADKDLPAYLRAGDFFVLPSISRNEAFGMCQLEAMAARLAVISTDLPGGVPWVNRHRRTGLVVPAGDADALAESMEILARNPDLCRQWGMSGQARVLDLFTQEKSVILHEELYRNLLVDSTTVDFSNTL
ncbi:MAG TPA: glycosyltransferase [bacterium]|nr:glycosyltransferase [bacterium]